MRRKSLRKKFLKIFFVISGLTISIVVLFFIINFFSIKKIDITINAADCVTKEDVKRNMNLVGQNLFFINIAKTRKSLKDKFVCIKDITVKKNFPNKVLLEVFGRTPQLALFSNLLEGTASARILELSDIISTDSASIEINEKNLVQIDDEGVMYSKNSDIKDETGKIKIINKTIQLGKSLDANIVNNIVDILKKLASLGINANENILFENYLIVKSTSLSVVFDTESNLTTQIASLQLIVQKAKIDNVDIEFIDLRFDKPVVRYALKKK